MDEIYKEMSELLRKQVHGVMKMKIPEANASPRKVCEENKRRKKTFFEKKDNKRRCRRTVEWISVNFGLLIPNRLKVLVL